MTIFDAEETTITRIEALLADDRHQGNPLLSELGDLLKQYEKLYKQLRHVISLSDRQQLRLNELNHQLAESNASKDKFFSIIAHDLRGPLSSLIGLSEVLQEQVRTETSNAALGYSVDLIYSSTKDLYTLLENLLTWSQIQRGTISYHPEQLDLAEICKFTFRLFQSHAQQKHLELVNNVPQGLLVETDYNMLSTVLRNLLSNAIKFTNLGGRICVSAKRVEENSIEVSVSDNGVGIPEEEQDKLFHLDQQYSGVGTRRRKRDRPGAESVQRVYRESRQRIWVESDAGQGTSFYFTLCPFRSRQSDPPDPDPVEDPERFTGDFSQYRMLVVDDVPANRQALIDFLRPFGFRFREAGNGQEAFTIWKRWQPQMIWMDIRMPVMDGYESAKQIKASDATWDTTIIALTASVPEEEYPNVLAAGYDSLLQKPFTEAEVLEIIKRHLNLRLDIRKQDEPPPSGSGRP